MKELILETNDIMILKNKNNMKLLLSSQNIFIISNQNNKSMSGNFFKPITQYLWLSLILAQTKNSLNVWSYETDH